MRNFIEIDKSIQDNPEIRKFAMNLAQEFFTLTQENLVRPMPWGDENENSNRQSTVITDQSLILISGVPPYWDSPNIIAFRYDASHSTDVEYGSEPKTVNFSDINKWVERKLKIKGKGAIRFSNNIVKKIKREGIPPHPFIRPAIEQIAKKHKLFRITVQT